MSASLHRSPWQVPLFLNMTSPPVNTRVSMCSAENTSMVATLLLWLSVVES